MDGLMKLFTSEGEEIAAYWRVPGKGMPVLLYSHGNAEDIGLNKDLFDVWTAEGFGVLAYDYPGYGLSTGKPSERACERAIATAWDFIQKQGYDASSLIVVGRSVGSGPSVWLAQTAKPAGLVLIAPFTSVYAVPLRFPLFPWDVFPNRARIRHMDTPLLVIQGEEDRVISVTHGRALATASAAEDKEFIGIPMAGHNDLFVVAGDLILDKINAFCRRVLGL